jgi:hypothetical protein
LISARSAALVYAALSIVLTWPLARGLAGDVPGDFGDSLLNMWILAWGAEHVPQLLTGAISWQDYWNANIFHPEPLTLALSEHLFGQTLQILPVYWLTGNIILCYNLLFLSTFVLSALGTFLLVRDLTGSTRAAFIAGLIYGFLPYRIASVPHLQVLSSQWMPFALWGFNRLITTQQLRYLAAGVGALVMQNWSCIYYLLFFLPFLVLFVPHRMAQAGKLGDLRTWSALAIGAVATIAFTVPFLLPYQDAHEHFGLERSFGEVAQFSANLWSYVTASENVRLWGSVLRFYPRAEGETFLGLMPWILGLIALVTTIASRDLHRDDPRGEGENAAKLPAWRRRLIWVLAFLAATQLIALISAVMFGGFDLDLFGISIRATTPPRLLLQFLVPFVTLLVLSPPARRRVAGLFRSPVVFVAFLVLIAVWLSLGPTPGAGSARVSGFALYGVLHDFVPGFNGLRVPARFAMIAGLFLALLAGFGAANLLDPPKASNDSGGRRRTTVFAVLSLLILAEGVAVPFEINRVWNQFEAVPPARVYPHHTIRRSLGEGGPPVYARLAALPRGTVVTEFPFGDGAWEIRYVYYAAAHFHPITNGYSGGFPGRYLERVARFQRVGADPEAAWQELRATGTTHVVVHRNAFANSADADVIESWLRAHGATELERLPDGDVLWTVN